MTSLLTNNLAGMDTTAGAAAMWPAAMKDYGTKISLPYGNWPSQAAGSVTLGTPNAMFFDTTRSWFTSARQPNNLYNSKELQWWQPSPTSALRTPQGHAGNLTTASKLSGGAVRYLSIGTITLSFDTGNGAVTATAGSTLLNSARTPYKQAQSRAVHAVWMRDLPKSRWFKKQFGVINKDGIPHTTGGTYLSAMHTSSFTAGTTTSIEIDFGSTGAGDGSAKATEFAASGVAEFVTSDGRIDSFSFSGCSYGSSRYTLTGIKFASLNHNK